MPLFPGSNANLVTAIRARRFQPKGVEGEFIVFSRAGQGAEFFSGGASVATFTGADVGASTGTGNCIGGLQNALGTCYVNINFLTQSFDKVVATSTSYAFEFDNVAFSTAPVGVPEPETLAMFGLGLLLVGSAYRFRARKSV
jgi:hypothetical protein